MDTVFRITFWLVVLAVAALAVILPGFLPAAVLAFIGHALVSLIGIAAIGLFLLRGLARAMMS